MQCEELSKELRRANSEAAERTHALESELATLRRSIATDTSDLRTQHAEELRAVRASILKDKDVEVERIRHDAEERVRRALDERDSAITRTAAAAAEEMKSVTARLEAKVRPMPAQVFSVAVQAGFVQAVFSARPGSTQTGRSRPLPWCEAGAVSAVAAQGFRTATQAPRCGRAHMMWL